MEIVDYIRDSRIRKNNKYKFRSRLCVEHIMQGEGVEEIYDTGDRQEKVLTFQEYGKRLTLPIQPFYWSGITSPKDKYLHELVKFYMHINPGIDEVGVKKMTEYIVRGKVAKNSSGNPILKFEDLYSTIQNLATKYKDVILKRYKRVFILFSESSSFSKEEKRQIAVMESAKQARALKSEIIHLAAQATLELVHPLTRVNNPKIFNTIQSPDFNTVDVRSSELIPSTRSVKNFITEDTSDMIEVGNRGRMFESDHTSQNFERFLELPKGITLDNTCKELNISKTTAKDFRDRQKDLNL